MTAELNFKKRNRKWSLAHRYEMIVKKRFLRKLSEPHSFKMLQELHKFTHSSKTKSTFSILDMDKIKALAEIHLIFSKIKT